MTNEIKFLKFLNNFFVLLFSGFSHLKSHACWHHKCPHNCSAEEFFNLDKSTIECRCPVSCTQNCTLPSNKTLRHHEELRNPQNPCEIFFCNNARLSTHVTTCAAINCPLHHRIRLEGACCEVCDQKFSTFCDDEINRDCDIACQFAYVRDEARSCDLCRCFVPTTTSSTIRTTTQFYDEQILNNQQNLQTFVIFLLIFVIIFTFGCLLTLLVCLVRSRMYKKIPLISQQQTSSQSVSTTSSGCESV